MPLLTLLSLMIALSINSNAFAELPRCSRIPDCASKFIEAQRLAKADLKEEALQIFLALQDKYADAQTLYPIAVLLHRLGRPGEAVPIFERYLDSGIETDQKKLEMVRQRLATARNEVLVSPPPPAQEVAPAPEKAVELSVPLALPATAHASPDASRLLHKRWWLWTIIGAVTASTAVGVGTYLGLQAQPPSWPGVQETRPFP